ncbi:Iron(III) dicitrate transport system permease protein FecD (TC 3.A.1.14.1) [Vagococcus fluvialis bH819]|uniref:Iron(III) dicitrate transport system permease protein FecD (TC 3.A.1.14.1) n=1 Tax=Vagococcus fluvialis bH819 TaxID=1255619 RepID=A0A1X6WMC3_9ENTE|nr:Iron(III) dicitrate transport system permease protein FecD (TC 3.A.1.14.1) [Vagococcus fluvialis bH819]
MTLFWKHSKQHSSKTMFAELIQFYSFWKHSKQHSSKTIVSF